MVSIVLLPSIFVSLVKKLNKLVNDYNWKYSGRGFDSRHLHQFKALRMRGFFFALTQQIRGSKAIKRDLTNLLFLTFLAFFGLYFLVFSHRTAQVSCYGTT